MKKINANANQNERPAALTNKFNHKVNYKKLFEDLQ